MAFVFHGMLGDNADVVLARLRFLDELGAESALVLLPGCVLLYFVP